MNYAFTKTSCVTFFWNEKDRFLHMINNACKLLSPELKLITATYYGRFVVLTSHDLFDGVTEWCHVLSNIHHPRFDFRRLLQ